MLEIFDGGETRGRMQAERNGLYMDFSAEFSGEEGKLYALELVGEQGSCALGVAEWSGGIYRLRKRLAARQVEKLGTLSCVEISAREETMGERWLRLSHPEYFFAQPVSQLAGLRPCLWQPWGAGRRLALPLKTGEAFPLCAYFCFAQVETIGGKPYAVFCIDPRGLPKRDAEKKQ